MNFSPLLSPKFIKGTLMVMAGNGLGAVMNYVYHPLAARYLVPEQFGYLESYINLNYFLAIITSAFSLSVIFIINQTSQKDDGKLLYSLHSLSLFLTILTWIAVMVFYFPAIRLLNLSHPYLLLIVSIQLLFSFIPTFYVSLLASRQKFLYFSLIALLAPSLKIILTWLLFAFGFQLTGALVGIVLPALATSLAGYFWANKLLTKPLRFGFNISLPSKFWRYFFLVFLSQASITSLYTADMLAVRIFYPQVQSGIYAAGSTLTRSLFFISTIICSVAFPMLTANKRHHTQERKIYYSAFFGQLALITAGAVVLVVQSSQIVNLTYGQTYKEVAVLIPWFVILMGMLGMYYLNYHYLLSVKPLLAVKLTGIAAVFQLLLVSFRHHSLVAIIQNTSFILALALLLSYLFSYRALYVRRN